MFQFLKSFIKEKEDPRDRLREKFASFRQLLDSNNQALALMADMEEKLTGDAPFDRTYLHTGVKTLGDHMTRMVSALNRLSRDRYRELLPLCRQLQEALDRELVRVPDIPDTPYLLPLHALNRDKTAAAGSKMANLGEIRHRLGLAVPRGFALTVAAYKKFMAASGLAARIASRLADANLDDLTVLEEVSRDIQDLVLSTPLPADLEEILRLTAQALPTDRLAVRSSAVGEDTEYSFAGQFATLLNITVDDLPAAYKQIVASKFTPQALFYLRRQGFSLDGLAMAVGVLAMAPACSSGVMFSRDPHDPQSDAVIINAVWGLGKYAVDGVVAPDLYVVERAGAHALRQQTIAHKPVALICQPQGGCSEVRLTPEQADRPCLSDALVYSLTEIALALEKHFGCPQDIEWAVDQDGTVVVLQSRPLRISATWEWESGEALPEAAAAPEVAPLVRHGVRAVRGAAAGPVYILPHDQDLDRIPDGAVVVTRQPSPRLVLVMDRINAIITELGSPTDHLTIVAREFRVPTLVQVEGAIRALSPGQLVTVDADATRVYPGIVYERLNRPQPTLKAGQDQMVYLQLRQIVKQVVPLHLIDPEGPDFSAAGCRTVHDLTRFCHEKAMDAMFDLEADDLAAAPDAVRLQTDLPVNLFILDLGQGLADHGGKEVEEKDVRSLPFQALLRGLRHPGLRWGGQVAADFKGFVSVFANTMYDAGKAERSLGGKSFAIITDRYLNFNSRLGYHFGLVDAYLSDEINDNYITFQFKGGAASVDRRERRVRLLNAILEDLGFTVTMQGDLVQGRLSKAPRAEMERTLETVSLLMAFCRQLDLALSSEVVADRCLQAFRQQDYSLACLRPA